MRMTDILADLVAIPSLPGTGNAAITDLICDHLDRPGVTLHRLPGPEGDRWNLLASIGPTDRPGGLMLSGHSDVVTAEGQSWSSDPFRLTRDGDRLTGRGTSDMKGFLSVMLDLVPDLLALKLHRPVHLAFSYDEEIGCRGVGHMIARLPELIARPAGCIVGEPSGLHPVCAHKGKQAIEVCITGKPGHSSDPAQGVNAVYPAARLALAIEELAARLRRDGPFDPTFVPPHSTLQAGVIEGGAAVNIIPERARLMIEARTVPAQTPQEVMAGVLEALDLIAASATAAGSAVATEWRELASYPALARSDDPALARLLTRLSGREIVEAVSYGTEAGLFAQAGIPSVICGPGDIGRAHRADEYVLLSELQDCRRVMHDAITRLCLEPAQATQGSGAMAG